MSNLPFSLYVALRYLKSTRRDALITFLSATAAGGIALGIAALILALAALTGFQAALRQEILTRTPQIEVELPPNADSEAARRSLAELPGVEGVGLLIRGRGWLLAEGRARPVELVGFDGELPGFFPEATDRAEGLYVGDRLATIWGLAAGDLVEVASTRPTLSPLGPQPRVRRLPMHGTFETGRTEQEARVALPLAEAASLLGRADTRLLVTAGGLEEALRLAPQVESVVPEGAVVRTWRDFNRALLFALRLEKGLMFVAVFLIVVVAAMSLVSDITLILTSKLPEVGMLGAMGARPRELQRIFLFLGGSLVAVGTLLGVVVGIGGAWMLDRYQLLSLPSQVYFLDHVPFLVRSADVFWILLATVLLTFGCSLYAASKAAALRPVEALRR
jgi:lipoprotein-releasing system permease protein